MSNKLLSKYRTRKHRADKRQIPAGKNRKAVRSVFKEDVMVLRVSSGGDAVIPREVCKKLGLHSGDQFELIQGAGPLTLVPANKRPKAYKRIYKRAVEVFQDEASATLWLNSPQFGLGGAIPVHRMRTAKGIEDVKNLLGMIRFGGVS